MTVASASPGSLPANTETPAAAGSTPAPAPDPKAGIPPAPLNTQTAEPKAGDKPPIPDWVPEKFRNAPDPYRAMADAYAEAEKALSKKADKGKTPANPDAANADDAQKAGEAAAEAAGLDFNALEAKYSEKGALDESDYEALAKAGIPKAAVDRYIRSALAESERVNQRFYDLAGDQDTFKSVVEWASKNVKPAELQAYNALLEAGNWDGAALVFQNFVSAYGATTSKLPERVLNAIAGANLSGVEPYRSRAEMTADMSNPKYSKDPAFREAVAARIAVTDF